MPNLKMSRMFEGVFIETTDDWLNGKISESSLWCMELVWASFLIEVVVALPTD